MINFNFMLRMEDGLKIENNKSNTTRLNNRYTFDNVLSKESDSVNKNTYNLNNLVVETKEDNKNKEKLNIMFDDLKELLDEKDFDLDVVVNLINFWNMVDLVDKNNIDLNNLSLESINGSIEDISNLLNIEIDLPNTLFREDVYEYSLVKENIYKEFLGLINFEDDNLIKVPIINESFENVFIGEVNAQQNTNENIDINMQLIKDMGFENIDKNDLEKILATFENNEEIKKSLSKLNGLNDVFESGVSEKYTHIMDVLTSYIKDEKIFKNPLDIKTEGVLKEGLKLNQTILKDLNQISYKSDTQLSLNDDILDLNELLLNQREFLKGSESSSDNELEKLIRMSLEDSKNSELHRLNKSVDIEVSNIDNDFVDALNQDVYKTFTSFDSRVSMGQVGYTIRQDFLGTDIIKTLTYMRNMNIKELTLKVNPKELGEISVQLTKTSDLSRVTLVVEREELFNVIKKDMSQIISQLRDSGVNVDNLDVQMKDLSSNTQQNLDFMSDSFNQNKELKENKSNKKNTYNKKDNEIESINENSPHTEVENEINLFA